VQRCKEALLPGVQATEQDCHEFTKRWKVLDALQREHDVINLEFQQAVIRYELSSTPHEDEVFFSDLVNERIQQIQDIRSNLSLSCIEAMICKGYVEWLEYIPKTIYDITLRGVVCVLMREDARSPVEMKQYDGPSEYLYGSMIKRAIGTISHVELLRIDAFVRRSQPDFGDQWLKLLARLHSLYPQFPAEISRGGSKDRYTGEEITFESVTSVGRPSCPNKVAHHCACFNE